MRLWIDGPPGLDDPPEELAEKAWRALAGGLERRELPVYSSANIAVRIRFVHQLEPLEAGPSPAFPGPAVSTLAWFWVHVLEGLLWESARQVSSLHAAREWGRVAGVEVIA